MESLSIAGGIIKVAKAIVKAASGVRQCKSRCQDLARRVEVIAELVRESEAAPSDSATRTRVLDRLRDALEEALEVVQSCRSFTKLLLAGRSTSSRIDDAERKINNCLLELGVANDVRLLGLGSQCQSQSQQATTAAGRVAVHDGVVPRTNTVVNNSGIVMNINAKCANVSLKQKSSMGTYISAGGSVSTYFGDSSSRNGIKEDSVAAIHNNRSLVSASAGRSTSSRIDNAERKIDNCLLELGVANDVRLGPGNQKTTTAGRLAVHDGVVPRTSTVVNNSGIVTNINAKRSIVSLKKENTSHTYISAGGSVNYYLGDSSSRNGIKEDSVAAVQNNSWRVSVPAGGSSGHVSVGNDFNCDARKQDVTTMRGKRWDDKNGQATAGERKREAAAAAGPQMLSTTRPAASDRYWPPPPQGPQHFQYPYGGAGDHGVVPYYNHHSAEEDPNSCSIM